MTFRVVPHVAGAVSFRDVFKTLIEPVVLTPKFTQAILILSPTRELALQIAAEAQRLVASLSARQRPLQVHTAFGGTARASNLNKFRNGDPAILVATPGRLNDILGEEDVRSKFDDMQTLILDEADRMLDAGKA